MVPRMKAARICPWYSCVVRVVVYKGQEMMVFWILQNPRILTLAITMMKTPFGTFGYAFSTPKSGFGKTLEGFE